MACPERSASGDVTGMGMQICRAPVPDACVPHASTGHRTPWCAWCVCATAGADEGGRRETRAKQGSRQGKQPVDSSRHSADSWESATRCPAGALGPNQEPRSARNRDDEQRGASTPPDLQLARKSAMLKQARIGNTQRAKHWAGGDALRGGVQAWNRPNKRPCPGEASAEWGWMALAGRA